MAVILNMEIIMNLHVALNPPTKGLLNRTYPLGAAVVNDFQDGCQDNHLLYQA